VAETVEAGWPQDIDPDKLLTSLRELSHAFVDGRQGHYGMRIPAEPYRDGDLVCGGAYRLITALLKERDRLKTERDAMANERDAWSAAAHHAAYCRECAELSVADCSDGTSLWEAAIASAQGRT
jgi:hypothetical protein